MNIILSDFESIKANKEVKIVLNQIATVSCQLSEIISSGTLSEGLGDSTGINSDGDSQKKLDIIADESFISGLKNSPVKYYASEEKEKVLELNTDGNLGVAIDPLDGSSNIDTNVSIGSIFSIRNLKEIKTENLNPENIFLNPGTNQCASGYVIFGPQTILVFTTGQGVKQYILDRKLKKYFLIQKKVSIPINTNEYAVNASNERHWSEAMKRYIEDSNAGEAGPRQANFNMRWVASLVAETHRIITRGGIFIYPSDKRKNYSSGRLRMVYECAPIAFLIEQADGAATDCVSRLMEISVDKLHSRTPFAFGSKNEIERLQSYYNDDEKKESPLFKKRGLFN